VVSDAVSDRADRAASSMSFFVFFGSARERAAFDVATAN